MVQGESMKPGIYVSIKGKLVLKEEIKPLTGLQYYSKNAGNKEMYKKLKEKGL